MITFRAPVPEDIPALRRLWQEAFGDSEAYLDLFFRTAYGPERCLLLESQGIAGAAYWLDCGVEALRLAYVYAVAIRGDQQNRGLGTALMRELHAHLTVLGYDGALLVPGDEGLRRYYRKLGYETVSWQDRFTAKAGSAAGMTRLDPGEYARQRREYLGRNGVVQEGEALALLAQMADFYAGKDFLAAVAPGDGVCLELLGEKSCAPGITAALGLELCGFRTPGSTCPYAMAHSLGQELPKELYFGFGFD